MASEADGKNSPTEVTVTCTAPVNIAVVKYWGKRDEKLILPTNASLSATLHQEQLCAKTTITASKRFKKDAMWLNGLEQPFDNPRLQNVLSEIRRRARKRKADEATATETENLLNWHIHICSENNFPTAAGLASSAAGLACLVHTLATLYKVQGDISEIARQGSGSACRSVYGGFVEWTMGKENNGSDSIAAQIAPEEHWPEMRVLILVVSASKKPIGSTAGMQVSVETSELLRHRANHIVPDRMTQMTKAIKEKDFNTFAELTMKDSNQLHACCLDTYPPITYLTDTSRDIIRLVHAVNKHFGENRVAYTFDAGPNACLYLMEKDVPLMLGLVQYFFPPETWSNWVRGLQWTSQDVANDDSMKDMLDAVQVSSNPGAIRYIIHTKVGPGPRVLTDPAQGLLNQDGLPKSKAEDVIEIL